jgi:hypothetical protein
MQIFKDISPDDYNITPFTVHKEWTFTSVDVETYYTGSWGLQLSEGVENSTAINVDDIIKGNTYRLVNNL